MFLVTNQIVGGFFNQHEIYQKAFGKHSKVSVSVKLRTQKRIFQIIEIHFTRSQNNVFFNTIVDKSFLR